MQSSTFSHIRWATLKKLDCYSLKKMSIDNLKIKSLIIEILIYRISSSERSHSITKGAESYKYNKAKRETIVRRLFNTSE